jgi:mannitol/fructose-specific phosphotransferase system IIA component (Ntr-type)
LPVRAGKVLSTMNLARLLKPEQILLELTTQDLPEEERAEIPREQYVWRIKEKVLEELSDLVNRSNRVSNRNKLYQDLLNRERKATTGLANGVAIPHVRTIYAKELLVGFARSSRGIEFDCLDGKPAHLFFVMVAPPYDDTAYLKLYRQLAEAFSVRDLRREFMAAESEGEILRVVKKMGQG